MFISIGPKWKEISRNLPGRTGSQIKSRFYSFINKKLKKEEFEDFSGGILHLVPEQLYEKPRKLLFNSFDKDILKFVK